MCHLIFVLVMQPSCNHNCTYNNNLIPKRVCDITWCVLVTVDKACLVYEFPLHSPYKCCLVTPVAKKHIRMWFHRKCLNGIIYLVLTLCLAENQFSS
jgi:hypothetical protein